MISFEGLRFSLAASLGHPVAQSPQPMHLSILTTDMPSCSVMACTWHLVLHVPQFTHSSGSIVAM